MAGHIGMKRCSFILSGAARRTVWVAYIALVAMIPAKGVGASRWQPTHHADGSYGLRFAGKLVANTPIMLNFADGNNRSGPLSFNGRGYRTVRIGKSGVVGTCTIRLDDGIVLTVRDSWQNDDGDIRLDRVVKILRGGRGGFATGVELTHPAAGLRTPPEVFVPGVRYGSVEGLSVKAIGRMGPDGRKGKVLQIREDRLPIPMTAALSGDGFAFAVLNPAPDGRTTAQDAVNFVKHGGDERSENAPARLTDPGFAVGAVTSAVRGAQQDVALGFVYPAIEEPLTYRGNTYPDAGVAAPRILLHPLKTGFAQRYAVIWHIEKSRDTPTLIHDSWRWAWQRLKPAVHIQDIEAVRRNLIAQLSGQVETHGARTLITNFASATGVDPAERDTKSVLGFTGKALETAETLLWAAGRYPNDSSAKTYRAQGEGLIDTFVSNLKLDPPAGEGFDMKTGAIALAIPQQKRVFLRSFGDDIKATLRAYRREAIAGRRHESWLVWCRTFGDWLLAQQQPGGGIARAWIPATGQVAEPSQAASFNAVPLWLLLTDLTGDPRYKMAAVRAGTYSWNKSGQRFGRFTGGTIDNPNVIDKESATLSLEAYLALFEHTGDRRWLIRARAAANVAETWIYAWDVPMVNDGADGLHWKAGVPTTGVQLIATGHSLVDEYMSFDVDEFAKLYRYTGDTHYREVARLLLNDTLAMTARSGQPFDLNGPGWQQEHWSLAPWRGHGLHRGWLPWVTTAHLNGMIATEEFDPKLYRELSQ